MNSQRRIQQNQQSNRCNIAKSFQSLLVSKRFQKYFKLIFLTIFCIIELIDISIKVFRIQQFSELSNEMIIFLTIAITSIIMTVLISFDIINSNLQEVLFCCLLGCLFETFLLNQQKTLRLCGFFIFSQRTINDMQKIQGNKISFFILVLYPAIRYSIENIYNIFLLIQNLLFLFTNYLFQVVKFTNSKLPQKIPRVIQQNTQKNNLSFNNQTDQSHFIQYVQDYYRTSDPHNINQTKPDQRSVTLIYNQTNNNNISILNDEDHQKFNSFQESKIKQTQFIKDESHIVQEQEISNSNKNIQNLSLNDIQIKLDNNIQKQPQQISLIDLIINQISVGIILLDSDKKLVYSNKILKKIINKGKTYGNISELTYLLSFKLQTIQKFQRQQNLNQSSTNQNKSQPSKIDIHQQKLSQNHKFDQLLKNQKLKREQENNNHPKGKQKQNQKSSAIYNQYQTRKSIQHINRQNILSSKQSENINTDVKVFSKEPKHDVILENNKKQNTFQNSNTKMSQSSKLLSPKSKLTNQPNLKEFLNIQDNILTQSFIGSKINHSQLQNSQVIQCILPNKINKLFTKENLQIDDVIDFLMKYSSPPQFQKMNTDTQILLEQTDEFISQLSNRKKKKKVKKKLYDYFIINNYLHVTVQQKGNDLSQQEIKHFGIKLCVLQLTDFESPKFVLIEASDITILKKQIDNECLDIYKNNILSSVSHELRTPLNCSIQLLDIMSQNDEISNIMKSIFIFPALNSNLLLLNIINDILDLAQINDGKFTMIFSQFELNQIFTECINLISIQALQKNIDIELDLDANIPKIIHSDSVRIRQVLLNILSNALKFTQVGKITIRSKLIDEKLIQVDIEDSGCGIAQKNLNILKRRFNEKDIFNYEQFQKNYQLNAIDIGLGLTITNNLATGLGGNRKLQVQSEENVGTKFSFWIINHSTHKLGCKFTKMTVFNKEVIKWKSILDSQQLQKYLHQSSNQNNTNTNIGQQQQNMSIRSRFKNEESSSNLQNNKYQQSVLSLIKFNNEIQYCKDTLYQNTYQNNQKNTFQNEESLTIYSHNMSPILDKKLNQFQQQSFKELSLLKENNPPILDTSDLTQYNEIERANSIDQISSKKYKKENQQKSYQINEINFHENQHKSELDQKQKVNKKYVFKLSSQENSKLKNNNPDSNPNFTLQMQQERENEKHRLEYQQPKNTSNNKQFRKTNSEFIHNLGQTQFSSLSSLSNQSDKINFNKNNQLVNYLPYTNQSTQNTINPSRQNILLHQIYTIQQKQMQELINEQNEEQYNIINLDNYENIQTPNQCFGQKVSEKRINNLKSINFLNSNMIQDHQISNNDIGVKIKFQDQNLNQMYQKEVMQNNFFHKDLLSDPHRLICDNVELDSVFDRTFEDAIQNDQIEMIEAKQNQTQILREQNEIQIHIKQPQKINTQYELNHGQKQELKAPTTCELNQKNQIITQYNQQNNGVLDQKNNNQLNISQLINPLSNTKQKLQSYSSLKKCQCPNILIVDDNDFNIYALETRLKSYEFIIDKATSGFIALDKVKNKFEGKQNCCKQYTLIFMDIEMPVKNGYETTKDILSYLHEKKVSKPSPISACTAYVQQAEQNKAKLCGMQFYITKPVNKQMLEEVLIQVIFDIKN